MRQLFLLTILFFIHAKVISQDTLKNSDKFHRPYTFNFDLDYNYQKCNGVEVGINLMTYNYSIRQPEKMMEFGLYLSCEYNFIQPTNIFGPKLAIGLDQLLHKGFGYSGKLNIVSYDPSKTNDLRLCPELGLTYLGVINIYYGYNIALTKDIITQIGAHKLSINLNIGYARTIVNYIAAHGGM